jgi:hypothetical protein
MHIDTGIQSNHHREWMLAAGRQLLQQRNLVVVVDHDLAYTRRKRFAQLPGRLVVAMKTDFGGRHSAAEGNEQFAARDYIQSQALLAEDLNQRGCEKSLAGIDHSRSRVGVGERFAKLPRGLPKRDLVEDVQGGAMAFCKIR